MMYGRAYLLSRIKDTTPTVAKAFHSLGMAVRARFSRESHPVDHWGNLNPEDRLHYHDLHNHHHLYNIDNDLEYWPKPDGTSLENMDISIR